MIDVINGNNYWKKYWKGRKFKLFDYGSFKRKNLIVHGRTDDVINIRCHRLGSEVESRTRDKRNNRLLPFRYQIKLRVLLLFYLLLLQK